MTYFESFDGTKIYYEYKKKSKQTIVFLHGWGLNHTAFNKSVDFFSKKGYSVLNCDIRGHGKSSSPEKKSAYSFKNMAKDLELLIKKLKLKNLILAGHSMGGVIMLKYLEKNSKQVDKLILIDSTYHNLLADLYFLGYLTKPTLKFFNFFTKFKKSPTKKKVIDLAKFEKSSDVTHWLQGISDMTRTAVWSCLEELIKFDETKTLKKIKIPTLIIEGEKDWLIPPKVAKSMEKNIYNSKLVMVDSAHDSIITSSKQVNKAMFNFIKKE